MKITIEFDINSAERPSEKERLIKEVLHDVIQAEREVSSGRRRKVFRGIWLKRRRLGFFRVSQAA